MVIVVQEETGYSQRQPQPERRRQQPQQPQRVSLVEGGVHHDDEGVVQEGYISREALD